jgi:hypothetical protein
MMCNANTFFTGDLDTDAEKAAKLLNQMDFFNSFEHQQAHYDQRLFNQEGPMPYHLFNPKGGQGCPFAPGCEQIPPPKPAKHEVLIDTRKRKCIHGHEKCTERYAEIHPFCLDCMECWEVYWHTVPENRAERARRERIRKILAKGG